MKAELFGTTRFDVTLLRLRAGERLASSAADRARSAIGPSSLPGFGWLDRVSLVIEGRVTCSGGSNDRVVRAGEFLSALHRERPVAVTGSGETCIEATEATVYCCLAPRWRPGEWRWPSAPLLPGLASVAGGHALLLLSAGGAEERCLPSSALPVPILVPASHVGVVARAP